jgi:hypothetical protein
MRYQHIIMLFSKPTFNNGLLKPKDVDSSINLNDRKFNGSYWILFQIIYRDSMYGVAWNSKPLCEIPILKFWTKF